MLHWVLHGMLLTRGAGRSVRFPADNLQLPAVNQLALHPRLQQVTSQLLGEQRPQ